MAKSENQKLKLLYLQKIFLEETDEENLLSIQDLINRLEKLGIKAERKSLYDDIECLRRFGLDIQSRRSKTNGYYVEQRTFELPELKLLVDAVQSSRLVTHKKSRELIAKLASLTSNSYAKGLKRQLYVAERSKTFNETVYYSIDNIHTAISENKQILFKYFYYDINKKRVYRKDGQFYRETPLSLCWADDNYYLICYNNKYDGLVHYRVDRMDRVQVAEEEAECFDETRFNVAEHAKQSFGMFSGELVQATLEFDRQLVNNVLDRFGGEVIMQPHGDRLRIHVNVSNNPVFLSWMIQFGELAAIIAPQSLKEALLDLMVRHRANYAE